MKKKRYSNTETQILTASPLQWHPETKPFPQETLPRRVGGGGGGLSALLLSLFFPLAHLGGQNSTVQLGQGP